MAERLRDEDIDILLMHETPYIPELFPFMDERLGARTALEAVGMIKPKVVINGHMHSGGFKTHRFRWGARYIYIDSSQASRHYLVLKHSGRLYVEVLRDLEKIDEIEI